MADSPSPEVVGDLLRARREAAGLSQRRLADLLGLAQQNVSAFEKGTKRPGRQTVLRLKAALGLDDEEVLLVAGLTGDVELESPAETDVLGRLDAVERALADIKARMDEWLANPLARVAARLGEVEASYQRTGDTLGDAADASERAVAQLAAMIRAQEAAGQRDAGPGR